MLRDLIIASREFNVPCHIRDYRTLLLRRASQHGPQEASIEVLKLCVKVTLSCFGIHITFNSGQLGFGID